jgi:hypothetical protein
MATKDRPHREVRKKPKAASTTKPIIQPLLDAPPQNVEVVRPRRKPRTVEESATE